LNLVPLARGEATFKLEDLQRASEDAEGGRVPAPVGAVQIETPVRRRFGARFDFEEMVKISRWARARGVGLHLDGARLFIEAAYTGRGVREYAALFDTVYVSMYKYFNAAGGAILAGPRRLLDGLFHTRRMFGGGVYESWPSAAVALHYLNGFESRFERAVKSSEQVIPQLNRSGHFEVERVPDGTNIFYLRTTGVNAPIYQQRLLRAGVTAAAEGARIRFQVNETWNRATAEEILRRFLTAVAYD
jgi:threonine aldolase